MLDMSMGATPQGPVIRILSAGARVAVTQLNPADRVSLVEFSASPRTILPLTDDVHKFESALRKTGNWIVEREQHHLYDSLLAVLATFPDTIQPDTRRCIVVLTTASDAGSRHSASEVALAAKSKGAAIFVALISPAPFPHPLGRATGPNTSFPNADNEIKALEPLVRPTGGAVRVYEANQYVIARTIAEMVNK